MAPSSPSPEQPDAESLRRRAAELEQALAKQTEQLDNLKKDYCGLLYSVSHDLRAPLMSIGGFADLLVEHQGRLLDETGRKYLQRIHQGNAKLARMLDELLKLARLSEQSMAPESVDLAVIARTQYSALQQQYPERQVRLLVAAGLPPARADREMISIALCNLLSNAWKYTERNAEARIEFGVDDHQPDKPYFVRDDGVGFDPRQAGRLFMPFKRLHGEKEFPGVGMGLATTACIIHRHGGRLWAHSRSGEGATFYFTLHAGTASAEQ